MKKTPKHVSIMNLGLKFHDQNIESSYNTDLFGYQNNYLKCFAISGFSVAIISWITNPNGMKKFEWMNILFNLLNISVLVFVTIFLFVKKPLRHIQTFLFLIQMYESIGFIEISRKTAENMKIFQFILMTIFLELVMLIPMISRCHWKFNALSSFFLNIYADIRYINIPENDTEIRIFTTSLFLLNFLIITIGSYISEKYDRRVYYLNKRNERSLKKFEFIFREIFPSAIIIHNQGKTVFYNKETLNLLEVNPGENVDDKISSIKLKNNNKTSAETLIVEAQNDQLISERKEDTNPLLKINYTTINQLIDTGKVLPNFEKYTAYIQSQTEEFKKILELKIGKIIWEGDEAILSIMTEDLNTQRINYLSEQASYKDQLLATVSHDLRTPLNGMIGILELTIGQIFDYHIRKKSSKLLLFMINDILDFSQIDQGKLSLNPIEFCVTDVVQEVSKLIKFQAKKKGISFYFQNRFPDERKKLILYNDPNRLKQVILNLLSNALKFTQRGFIKISIEPNESTEDGRTDTLVVKGGCCITVEDTGSGIKKEDLPKLFKLFGKLENSEAQRFNPHGVGLGLAISQNLVKHMNKKSPQEEVIKVTSEYGKGTIFSFKIFPMRKVVFYQQMLNDLDIPEEEGSNEEERVGVLNKVHISLISQSKKYIKRKKHILLVDDDLINTTVLKAFFKSFDDCEYDMAFHGEAALNLVKSKAKEEYYYDIIFMDCNMPVMDGFEATRLILELVEQKVIPEVSIIASTANVSNADMNRCIKGGMVDFISKPFSQDDIRKKINTWTCV